MRANFDLYVRRDTWLHRLDPRVKLAFVIVATLLTFLWPTVWTAIGMILLTGAATWQARIPAAHVIRVWRVMVPLVILVFGLTALFGNGDGAIGLHVGPLGVTPASVLRGVLLSTRLLALALIVALWLFTTDQATMVRGFVALRLPYEWGLTLALALRYLPLFAGQFEQVRDAQQARGLDLEGGGFWRRLQAYRPVLVAMMINALRNSERLGWALEARAVGARGVRRSVFRPLRLQRTDVIVLIVLTAVLIGAVLLRLL